MYAKEKNQMIEKLKEAQSILDEFHKIEGLDEIAKSLSFRSALDIRYMIYALNGIQIQPTPRYIVKHGEFSDFLIEHQKLFDEIKHRLSIYHTYPTTWDANTEYEIQVLENNVCLINGSCGFTIPKEMFNRYFVLVEHSINPIED